MVCHNLNGHPVICLIFGQTTKINWFINQTSEEPPLRRRVPLHGQGRDRGAEEARRALDHQDALPARQVGGQTCFPDSHYVNVCDPSVCSPSLDDITTKVALLCKDHIQVDTSGCSLGLVDIKTKVASYTKTQLWLLCQQNLENNLMCPPVLKRNFGFVVNKTPGTT